jgi:predicted DNA-binding protein
VGVAAAVEATCITMVHAAATAVQEATAVRESVDLRVKDVEDQAALAEREALERVSRVEAENAVALVSAREDAEGFV